MQNPASISISYETIVKVFATALLLWMLYTLSDVVLVVITAIVIASAAEPGARWFIRYGIPRVFAVIFIYITFIGLFATLGFFFVPAVLSEAASMVQSLSGSNTEGAMHFEAPFIGDVSFAEIAAQIQVLFQRLSQSPLEAVSAVFGGITSFILIIVFSFYFAVQEKGIEDFLRIITPLAYEEYIVSVWNRTQEKIALWAQGQFILGVLIGVFTYLGLSLLEVPYALLLAVTAGCLEVIPLFGPVLSAVPAIAFAYMSGGFQLASMVTILYLIIQQFENHLIYPLVVTKVVGVPPVMIILSLVIGLKLAGFYGVLLAVPMAALVQEAIADWDKKRHTHHIKSA
jgi:predicted PurR-regulated permease PerM